MANNEQDQIEELEAVSQIIEPDEEGNEDLESEEPKERMTIGEYRRFLQEKGWELQTLIDFLENLKGKYKMALEDEEMRHEYYQTEDGNCIMLSVQKQALGFTQSTPKIITPPKNSTRISRRQYFRLLCDNLDDAVSQQRHIKNLLEDLDDALDEAEDERQTVIRCYRTPKGAEMVVEEVESPPMGFQAI